MSAFEYFFGFYSIVLGLSVVELLTGVARTIEQRAKVKPSRLTLLLAAFVALDLSSYWLQAWGLYRGAPLSMGVLTHGLLAAGAYFVAAYLVFPRETAPRGVKAADTHFWATRRWVFGLILFTNVLNVGTLAILARGFGFMGPPWLMALTATFYIACAVASVAQRGRVVVAALGWLVFYSVLALVIEAAHLAGTRSWTLGGPGG